MNETRNGRWTAWLSQLAKVKNNPHTQLYSQLPAKILLLVREYPPDVTSACLTLSQTSPGFYLSAVQVFWKHCGEKEKLLVTRNFSFSYSAFYLFGELITIFIKFELVVCKFFQFGSV